jgi:hypothetical protein
MEKPLQLNLSNNMAWCSPTNVNQNNAQPQPTLLTPMPYGFYPSPHMYFPNLMQQQWPSFPQPPSSQAYGVPQPNPTLPPRPVKGPCISEWLWYCDCVPGCDGEAFFSLAHKFDEQGYQTIDQLIGSWMSVENLSSWLHIGRGTVDLIIQYAKEDMAFVREGKFTMDPALRDPEAVPGTWDLE